MSLYVTIFGAFLALCALFWAPEGADFNVGTTLFTKADTFRECWSTENLALLTSRMILEDLLPSPQILVIDCNEFVTDLVEYFRLILEIVRCETHGKTKHITLVALTDLLGGYLHHAVLPVAKYSYYSGLIDITSMESLTKLAEELKIFLRTNGQGWAKPMVQNLENFDLQRITLPTTASDDDDPICHNFILINPAPGALPCDVLVPLPFFDSVLRPSSVALPLKTCPLRNLEDPSSSYLLMKFFINAYKCLLQRNARSENMRRFQEDVTSWIERQIMPRLDDVKFYAAFGGILRIRYTFKREGVAQLVYHKTHETDSGADVAASSRMSRQNMILMAILIAIIVWFILGTMFICWKMKAARAKKDECDDFSCATESSTPLCSSKYFYPEPVKRRPQGGGSNKKSSGCTSPETSNSDIDVRHKKRGTGIICTKAVKWAKNKMDGGNVTEIKIRNCRCKENEYEDEDEDGRAGQESDPSQDGGAVIDADVAERRLPSITELSEQSNSENNRAKRRVVTQQEALPPGSVDEDYLVRSHVYDDATTETETEETE